MAPRCDGRAAGPDAPSLVSPGQGAEAIPIDISLLFQFYRTTVWLSLKFSFHWFIQKFLHEVHVTCGEFNHLILLLYFSVTLKTFSRFSFMAGCGPEIKKVGTIGRFKMLNCAI